MEMLSESNSRSALIANDNHRYPPVGRCIYCGSAEGQLSDEHIMPLALNGRLILPKASCEACQKRTQKIEEVCTAEKWGMFYPLRARFKLRSRNGWKSRRDLLTEVLPSDGTRNRQRFECDSFPTVCWGIESAPAGILLGMEPTNKIECKLVMRVHAPGENFNPSGESPLVRVGTFRITAFFQLIAKIGYAFAAAETGTDGLLPMLADIVLWRSDKAPYLIGGGTPTMTGMDTSAEKTEYLYKLQMHECVIQRNAFSLVSVHLFGQLGMPKYHVVVRHRRS